MSVDCGSVAARPQGTNIRKGEREWEFQVQRARCRAPRRASCLRPGVALGATASAETRLTLGITSNLSTVNPYGDSASHLYGLWGEIYGNLCRYSFDKGGYVGHLAEKWEVEDENTWLFHLKKGMKFHNGTEVTAKDVVHSFFRMSEDPESSQKQNSARKIKSVEAVDKYTVKMISHKPTSSLLSYICGLWAITSKDTYDKYGAKEADKEPPLRRRALTSSRNSSSATAWCWRRPRGNPFLRPGSPDIVIVRKMTESEQRVTALLNGEVQIAQFIPPHLLSRIEKSKNARLVPTSSVEIMFLAMNPGDEAVGQPEGAPGGLPRHQPRGHRQGPAQGTGAIVAGSDRSGTVRL